MCVSTPGYTHKAGTSNYVSNIIKSGVCLCLFVTSVCHKICMFEHLSVCHKLCMFKHLSVCHKICMFEQTCILGLSHLNNPKVEQRPPKAANLRVFPKLLEDSKELKGIKKDSNCSSFRPTNGFHSKGFQRITNNAKRLSNKDLKS